jgi:hypothetical protein
MKKLPNYFLAFLSGNFRKKLNVASHVVGGKAAAPKPLKAFNALISGI